MSESTDKNEYDAGLSMDFDRNEAEFESRIAERVAEQLDEQQAYRGIFGRYRYVRDRGRKTVRRHWDHYNNFVAPPDDDDGPHPGVPEVFQGRRGRIFMAIASVMVLAGWCLIAWALWP